MCDESKRTVLTSVFSVRPRIGAPALSKPRRRYAASLTITRPSFSTCTGHTGSATGSALSLSAPRMRRAAVFLGHQERTAPVARS
jgi:hypothetical protein